MPRRTAPDGEKPPATKLQSKAAKKLLMAVPPTATLDDDCLPLVLSIAVSLDKTSVGLARVCRAWRAAMSNSRRGAQLLGVVRGLGHLPPLQPLLSSTEEQLTARYAVAPRTRCAPASML